MPRFAVAEAFCVKLFADIVAVSVIIPPVIFVPIADHAAVTELDVIKVQGTDAFIRGAVASRKRLVHDLQDLYDIFVADLDDIRQRPFGKLLCKQGLYMPLSRVAEREPNQVGFDVQISPIPASFLLDILPICPARKAFGLKKICCVKTARTRRRMHF